MASLAALSKRATLLNPGARASDVNVVASNAPKLANANVFTAAQTVRTDVLTQMQFLTAAGLENLRISNASSSPNRAGTILFFGDNGLRSDGMCAGIGVDVSAAVPNRDLVLGFKAKADGTVSDLDGIYISNGGAGPGTVGMGISAPGDTTPSMRVKIQSGIATQGELMLRAFASQTAPVLRMQGQDLLDHWLIDPTTNSRWVTILRADSTLNSPVFSIQDQTTLTPQFEVNANGRLVLGNDTNSAIYRYAAGTVGTTGGGRINGTLTVVLGLVHSGTSLGFFGHATTAQPTGTPAAATDLASVISLANSLRTALLSEGLVA